MEGYPMLAEKFFLRLESIIFHAYDSVPANCPEYPDGAPKVKTQEQHVPIKLPEEAK
jgi:hypothetical protein